MAAAETNQKSSWGRVLRPLLWWLLLVLVLYGIRLNQRLLEQTRLYFSISLNGQPLTYPVTVAWDGKPITNGENILLGNHRFAITGPKTGLFTTNLFIWYGKHDLGEIRLMRKMGTLSVKADPSAQLIAISGPEFSTNLQDSSGADLIVPTDSYNVYAQYRYWSDSQSASVIEASVSPVTFSPKLGAVDLTCNRDGATYQLQNESGQIQESGSLPARVGDLPMDDYQVTAVYHHRMIQNSVAVEAGTTNDVPFQFVLGTVQLETMPSGAEVHMEGGNYLGPTPLLTELPPQATRFDLSLAGYEPVSLKVDITADQTNFYSTNLVSIGYVSAMREARSYLAESNFEAAAQAASAALNSKPDDADAVTIQNEANGYLSAERQQEERLQRPKKWFNSLCSEYRYSNLFLEHELDTTKPAGDVAAAIAVALTNAPDALKVLRTYSPEPDIYDIVAQQIGILGGSERDCLIVVGQPKDTETQIRFKVLEFQIQHHFVSNGLSNLHDDKQMIPFHPSRMQMNDLIEARVKEGVQIVSDKIQKAIGQ